MADTILEEESGSTAAIAANQTNGTQKTIVRGGDKGATTAADVTSTNQSADRQALDVQIRTSAGVAIDAFGAGQQYVDGVVRGTATGTLAMGDDGTNIQSLSVDSTGKLNINSISGAVSLPTGAATSANQTTLGSQTTKVNDGTNTAAVKAASTAAVATDPALVVAISPNNTLSIAGGKTSNGGVPDANNVGVLPAIATAAAPSYTEGNQVAASTLLNGALRTDNTTWLGSSAPTVGQKAMASSIPVVISSDQSDVGVKQATASSLNAQVVGTIANGSAVGGNPVQVAGENAAGSVQRLRTAIIPPVDATPGLVTRDVAAQTGTSTNVTSSASNTTILAANTGRLGATVFNDSNSNLFIKLGATASSTSFTARLIPNAYYETPFGYTGIIDGIWANANGSARVTEMT